MSCSALLCISFHCTGTHSLPNLVWDLNREKTWTLSTEVRLPVSTWPLILWAILQIYPASFIRTGVEDLLKTRNVFRLSSGLLGWLEQHLIYLSHPSHRPPYAFVKDHILWTSKMAQWVTELANKADSMILIPSPTMWSTLVVHSPPLCILWYASTHSK